MARINALVIGYGNEIRGDDGIGPYVAGLVDAWALPDVQVRIAHQLTPEMAELAADADLVIFVDACPPVEAGQEGVRVTPVDPEQGTFGVGHTGSPENLMDLAKTVYGHCPPAYLVAIPGTNFEFGTELSPEAQQGAEAALEEIRKLLA